jgi:uncharacterized protein YlzI (FlbEa/FlbD family)
MSALEFKMTKPTEGARVLINPSLISEVYELDDKRSIITMSNGRYIEVQGDFREVKSILIGRFESTGPR